MLLSFSAGCELIKFLINGGKFLETLQGDCFRFCVNLQTDVMKNMSIFWRFFNGKEKNYTRKTRAKKEAAGNVAGRRNQRYGWGTRPISNRTIHKVRDTPIDYHC